MVFIGPIALQHLREAKPKLENLRPVISFYPIAQVTRENNYFKCKHMIFVGSIALQHLREAKPKLEHLRGACLLASALRPKAKCGCFVSALSLRSPWNF